MRASLLRNPKQTKPVGVRLNEETDKRLEIICASLDIIKSDAVEAGIRLLLAALEDPSIINVERLRGVDSEVAEFLARLVERRAHAKVVVA